MPRGEKLSLPECCRFLRLNYWPVYRMILRRELEASQDRRGRYWITRGSVERMRQRLLTTKSARPVMAERLTNNPDDGQRRRRVQKA